MSLVLKNAKLNDHFRSDKVEIQIKDLVLWHQRCNITHFYINNGGKLEKYEINYALDDVTKTILCKTLDSPTLAINKLVTSEKNNEYQALIDTLSQFKPTDTLPRIGLGFIHTKYGSFPLKYLRDIQIADKCFLYFKNDYPIWCAVNSDDCLTDEIVKEANKFIKNLKFVPKIEKLLKVLVELDEKIKESNFLIRAQLILNYKQAVIKHLVKVVNNINDRDPLAEIKKLKNLVISCKTSLTDLRSSLDEWQTKLDGQIANLAQFDDLPTLKVATPAEATFDGEPNSPAIKESDTEPTNWSKEPIESDTPPPLEPIEPEEEESQAPPITEEVKPRETKESLCIKSFSGQFFVTRVGSVVPFESCAEAIVVNVGDRSKCHFLLFDDKRSNQTLLWVSIDGMDQTQHFEIFNKVQKRFPHFYLRDYVYESHVSPAMINEALSFTYNDVEIRKPTEFFVHGDSSANWVKLHKKLISNAGHCKTLLFQSRKRKIGWVPGRTMFVIVENLKYDYDINKLFDKINVNDDFVLLPNYTVDMIENIVSCDTNDKELVQRFTKSTEIKGDTIILTAPLQKRLSYKHIAKEFLAHSNKRACKFVRFNDRVYSNTEYSLAVTIDGMKQSEAIELFQSLPLSRYFRVVSSGISEQSIESNSVPFVYDKRYKTTYYQVQKFYGCNDVKESLKQLKELKDDFEIFDDYEFFGPFESPDLDCTYDAEIMGSDKSLPAKLAQQMNQAKNYPFLILKTTENYAYINRVLVQQEKISCLRSFNDKDLKKIEKLISSVVNKQ